MTRELTRKRSTLQEVMEQKEVIEMVKEVEAEKEVEVVRAR